MLTLQTTQTQSTSLDNTNRTDISVFSMWLEGKAKSTQSSYKTGLKQFCNFIENKPLREVTLEDMYAYSNHLQSSYSNSNTQKNKIQIIKSLFGYAFKIGYVRFNVTMAVKGANGSAARNERILAKEQINALFAVANEKEKLILSLGYKLGLRVSEIISIKGKNISEIEGNTVLKVLGKGAKERFLIIPPDLKTAIAPHINQEYIIYNYKGNQMSRVGVHKLLKNLAKKAGITENLSTHWLRHSHATHSLANGCDLSLLCKSMGHSSIKTTSVYLHCNPKDCSSNYL